MQREEQLRRKEWIRRILSRIPYTIDSPMYEMCSMELDKLSSDCLMICALSVEAPPLPTTHPKVEI